MSPETGFASTTTCTKKVLCELLDTQPVLLGICECDWFSHCCLSADIAQSGVLALNRESILDLGFKNT